MATNLSQEQLKRWEAIPIESDEALVLLTDGITEAEDSHGAEYGIDRTLEYIRAHYSIAQFRRGTPHPPQT